MYFLQILPHEPSSRIEPLQGTNQIDKQHIDGMEHAHVSLFVQEDSTIPHLIVFARHHNEMHPAERFRLLLGQDKHNVVPFLLHLFYRS